MREWEGESTLLYRDRRVADEIRDHVALSDGTGVGGKTAFGRYPLYHW